MRFGFRSLYRSVSRSAGKSYRRRPVLEILEEDGVYPNLYVGKNMAENVPQDLYAQDWWYRTTFEAPSGHAVYSLGFPGVNYRAEIWLNGQFLFGRDEYHRGH